MCVPTPIWPSEIWRDETAPACQSGTFSGSIRYCQTSCTGLAISTESSKRTTAALHVSLSAVRFEHVLVVGAGQMGAGIAQVVASSGRRVSLHDAAPGAVDRGREAMRKSLTRRGERGGGDPAKILGRVKAFEDLLPADLMIEAVVEDVKVKQELFPRAD